MKPKTTAIARAPQSRGTSASLRRLAVRRAGNVLAASTLFALGAASAQAQGTNYQYTGGGAGTATTPVSGVFSTGFTPTIVSGGTTSGTTTNDTLSFGGTDTGAASYTATDDLTTTINVNALSFSNIAGVVATLARGGTGTTNSITLGASTSGTNPTVTTGAGAVVNGLDLILAAPTTFSIGAGGFAQNGVVSGTGSLTQSGTGTLTLSKINTYTGGTTVNGGTLALAAGGGSGAVRGVVTVNTGATLNLTANNALGYNAGSQVTALNINGGTVSVAGNQGDEGYLTSFNLTGGTLAYAAGSYQIAAGDATAPGITSNASAITSVISGGVNIRSGNLGFSVASGAANGIDLLVSGAVTQGNTGFGLTKTGAGVMALTNTNTYTGPTTISVGTLQIGNGGTAGTLATSSAITDNGTFAINRSNAVTQGTDFSNAAITGTGGLTQSGAGNTTLNVTNTYTGATVINGGTLTLTVGNGGAGALSGTPTITVNNGGTLNLTNTDTLGYTAGKEALVINSGGTVQNNAAGKRDTLQNTVTMVGGTLSGTGGDISGAYSFNNPTAVIATSDANGTAALINANQVGLQAGNETFNVTRGTKTPASDLTISSVISNFGNFGLIKTGNGILTLSGANIYVGGTSVNAGILTLANSLALQNSTLTTVSSGTVFDASVASHAFTLGGLAGAGNLALQDNAATPNAIALSVGNNNAASTYSGVLSNAGSLTKIGTGTTTLSGLNTYTGGTTVNSGTLALATNSSSGTVQGVVTVNTGATLSLANRNALGYNAGQQVTTVNINGGTVNTTGAVGDEGFLTSFNLTGGTLAYTNSDVNNAYQFAAGDATHPGITSNASAIQSVISGGLNIRSGSLGFNVASGTTTSGVDLLVSGAVTSGGALGITKSGAGTMLLSGANTYNGATIVNQGTLTVQGTGATLGTGALAVNNANTGAGTNVIVNFNTNSNQTVNGLSSTVAAPASGANTAQVTIASGSTLTDNQSGTTNYAGSVSGGGTLAIGGQSSAAPATVNYTGTDSAAQTNVNANTTLQLNNATGPALSGPVAVATSGTVLLGGNNTNNEIATTAPGTASPTNVALNGGTLNANGHSDGTTNGVADPTQAAVTSSMGTLSLASGASTLDFGSGSTNDIIAFADSLTSLQSGTGTLNIINYTGGTDALYIGTSQDLTQAELSRITFGGNITAIQYSNGLVAAPEPSQYVSFAVGLLGLGALALRAKKRKAAAAQAA